MPRRGRPGPGWRVSASRVKRAAGDSARSSSHSMPSRSSRNGSGLAGSLGRGRRRQPCALGDVERIRGHRGEPRGIPPLVARGAPPPGAGGQMSGGDVSRDGMAQRARRGVHGNRAGRLITLGDGGHEEPPRPCMTSSAVCPGSRGQSRIRAIGGTIATAARYNQLRVDEASTTRKTARDAAIQQAASIHSVRTVVMEPDFHWGFDEADHGKDVQRVSVQESSTSRVYAPGRGATRKIALNGMLYSEGVTALLNTTA